MGSSGETSTPAQEETDGWLPSRKEKKVPRRILEMQEYYKDTALKNLRVFLDLDTVEVKRGQIKARIIAAMENYFQVSCRMTFSAYTSDIKKIPEIADFTTYYPKRLLLCPECRRKRGFEPKDNLLELEFLKEIGIHAVNVKKYELPSTLIIISNDSFFNTDVAQCMRNQGLEIFCLVPPSFGRKPMYRPT